MSMRPSKGVRRRIYILYIQVLINFLSKTGGDTGKKEEWMMIGVLSRDNSREEVVCNISTVEN